MSERHFTRADVVAKVLSLKVNASGPTMRVEVVMVELLQVVERPMWRVDLIHKYTDGRSYNFVALVTERVIAGKPMLSFVLGMPLPKDAKSVEEEDQLIEARAAQ